MKSRKTIAIIILLIGLVAIGSGVLLLKTGKGILAEDNLNTDNSSKLLRQEHIVDDTLSVKNVAIIKRGDISIINGYIVNNSKNTLENVTIKITALASGGSSLKDVLVVIEKIEAGKEEYFESTMSNETNIVTATDYKAEVVTNEK